MEPRAVEGPVVFLGTPEFAVPSLEALVRAGEAVALVVTPPDRPRGRSRRPEPPPVKRAAEALGLPVFQPERVSDPDAVAELRRCSPEFLVVVAYGQILRRPLLDLPSRGVVNLHPSLLPRHRGPSPVAWSILCGDDRAGVSTMLLDEGLDTGPVLLQRSAHLSEEATRGELEVELAATGARLLLETLGAVRRGEVVPVAQDPSRVTMSQLLTRPMRVVDWELGADEVRRRVHALSPSPAVAARLRGRLVKLLRVRSVAGSGPAGRVLPFAGEFPVVACGRGAVALLEVQPEGKRPMSGADFARGGGAAPGDLVEAPWSAEGEASLG